MVAIHPLISPWGRFGLYSFYIDAPEPAIASVPPSHCRAEALSAAHRTAP